MILKLFLLLLIETTIVSGKQPIVYLKMCENLTYYYKKHWTVYMLFLQVLLQIQSDLTQAPGICLHQIGGDC